MKRILLADTNTTLRSALALLLETRLGAQIVGQVSSMESLLCEAAATNPDLIILSQTLPGEPAAARINALCQRAPHAYILISGTHPEDACLEQSAAAFLCQTDPPEAVLNVIQSLVTRQA